MIAKIGHGANLTGALSYNLLKVDRENGRVIATQSIFGAPDGSYSMAQLYHSFSPYLKANRNTEKPVLHISLNPDPADKVSDEKFAQMAGEYMQEMGYGKQPYVVFKHTDTERAHIHIVSVCVDEEGRKIPDKFERKRSMQVCRSLEVRHGLIPATEKEKAGQEQVFRPLDLNRGDIKSQIAAVVRYLPQYYRCQSLGAYNALLSLFNITAEEVRGELHGQPKRGLVYFALNEKGEKAGNPFKASLFGKHAGIDRLEEHFGQSRESMKTEPAKATLKNTIETALHISSGEVDFKSYLLQQGINTVTRRNAEGRLYGITFIDHSSRTVWNGSQLGKHLSANIFNDLWSQPEATKEKNANRQQGPGEIARNLPAQETLHPIFDFLDKHETGMSGDTVGDILGGWFPAAQGEDYEELAFQNRMKKKKRKRRRGNEK